MFDLSKVKEMMEQAQGLSAKLQEDLSKHRITTSAAGGKVRVTLNGRKEVVGIEIAPDAQLDSEELIDLLLGCMHRGYDDCEEWLKGQMTGMTGGLDLGSLGQLFKK